MHVSQLDVRPEGLNITFGDSSTTTFSWRWLRDHDRSPGSFNAVTSQRTIDTFSIPENLHAAAASVNDGTLQIVWADGTPETTIQLDLLARVGSNQDVSLPTSWTPTTLPDAAAAPLAPFSFDAIASHGSEGDGATAEWLRAIDRYGFALVDGIPPTLESTESLVRRIGPPLETVFGTMWMVESGSIDHADSAYSSEALEPHTDGTYVHDAPGLQLLHFTRQADAGGASLLVDGLAVVEQLRTSDPEAVEVLSTTVVPGHYVEPGVDLRAERPPLRFDAAGQLIQISFNNYDRSPMWLEQPAMERFYNAYSALHARIANPDNQLNLNVRPGQALVFDNWRVLHGRTGFEGQRIFNGAYVARDQVDSRRRVLSGATPL